MVRAYKEQKTEASVLLALLGSGAVTGGSGAGGSCQSPVSGACGKSKSEVAKVAASAGTGKLGEKQRPKEVIDLCDSP